nr:S-phase kinase-associated protein 1-like [Drosophila bipectinata]
MPIIKLQSSDGEIFDTDIEIVKCSGTITNMLEDCGMGDDENDIVPLLKVNSTTLRKVLEWARYHKNDPKPREDDESKAKRIDDIKSRDAEFLKVDREALFELIMAANYLDIKDLLELTCKAVADMIKGKTPEEIRMIFNIRKMDQFRKENEWSEEK